MRKSKLKRILRSYFPFGFQLSRKSWNWLDIASVLDALDAGESGSKIYTIRRLADRLNKKYQISSRNVEPVQAGQLFSIGVLNDILRYLNNTYCHSETPGIIPKAFGWIDKTYGASTAEKPPSAFVTLYPPAEVNLGKQNENEYLLGTSEISTNKERVAGEIILLALAVENPAFKPFRDLFDDTDLKRQSPVVPFLHSLEHFFDNQPPSRLIGMKLFEMLRAPMKAAPDSLDGQLRFIKDHWAQYLPPELLEDLLLATDILREEELMRGLGPGQIQVPDFTGDLYLDKYGYPEPEGFSHDADWMSNVVLIAKSVYVWLDQLSKKYKRHIRYLSDIPDEELARLSRWGFTGLWLIGLWERSPASQKIKQKMGNPEAVASAYSLYDYVIAGDLGGENAYQNLRERAWKYGIRLASDMVPNHVGIYSKWVIEHPDWFIQLRHTPFPSYRFSGEDLSWDSRVSILIEDGYWDRRDAAVVFMRVDKWTGDVRYIYHGNDGTSMPWNDTAQLNFLIPEVRESVIQTIIHVARKFPIIRFDAAMTLAKKHYQRLWFPLPGEGGAIPSRAEYGMSRAQFDKVFPREFWREVVDRLAAEVPETLLLAEAFWLMEGYFVRTLGMHRVYNSAFMNMLKMEDNCKYRLTVKNVLEFSPEVIKRFVNFMNNPDEATAIEQFGKGDKYFGVVLLMVTMPGLPMFGHGQIEGFTEKYGMEYRRAYWDEQVDEDMVRRHEHEIFPLMRRRKLFSGAANFAFYDYNSPEGWVDENVFAYSNRYENERAIILYNNAYNTTRGWIHTSTAINIGSTEDKKLIRRSLAEALGLNTGEGYLYAFRDHKTGLQYLRSGGQIAKDGFYAELYGYQYHAFIDFKEIYDSDGSWRQLMHRLNGAGVPDLNEAYKEMRHESVLNPLRDILQPSLLNPDAEKFNVAREELYPKILHFLHSARDFIGSKRDLEKTNQQIEAELESLPIDKVFDKIGIDENLKRDSMAEIVNDNCRHLSHVLITWIAVYHLGEMEKGGDPAELSTLMRLRFEDWLLSKNIHHAFSSFIEDGERAYFDSVLVKILSTHDNFLTSANQAERMSAFGELLDDPSVREYLRVNKYNEIFWLSKEQLERMIAAFLQAAIIKLSAGGKLDGTALSAALQKCREIKTASEKASYQVEKTIQILQAKV
jgi:glycosidase